MLIQILMAKKQCRYYSAALEKALPGLLGQTVNVVLQDGQVHYLKLISFRDGRLSGTDGTDGTHHFPLPLVHEVIAEKSA